jgi:hypothetical protein
MQDNNLQLSKKWVLMIGIFWLIVTVPAFLFFTYIVLLTKAAPTFFGSIFSPFYLYLIIGTSLFLPISFIVSALYCFYITMSNVGNVSKRMVALPIYIAALLFTILVITYCYINIGLHFIYG